MTDFEYILSKSPSELTADFGKNSEWPKNKNILQKKFGLSHDPNFVSSGIDWLDYWNVRLNEIIPGVTLKISYRKTDRGKIQYVTPMCFTIYRVHCSKYDRNEIHKCFLEYEIVPKINITEKKKLKDIMNNIQVHYNILLPVFDMVSDWIFSGKIEDEMKKEGNSFSPSVYPFQFLVNSVLFFRRHRIELNLKNIVRFISKLIFFHNSLNKPQWLYDLVGIINGYQADILNSSIDFEEINKWISDDQYRKKEEFKEKLEKANREFALSVSGLKSHLSEKYNISEAFIDTEFYDSLNDKLKVIKKIKEEYDNL